MNASKSTLNTLAALSLLLLATSCAAPSTINLGGVSYLDRAASRVELGGLGLRASDGAGYHHLASASECALQIPVSLDLIVENFPSALQGFDPPKLKAIAQRYARTRDALKESSLMALSIRDTDLEAWFKENPSEHCVQLIERNLEDIRFISSVLVVVQHQSIQSSTDQRPKLVVSLGNNGELNVKAEGGEEALFIANATDIIAYRSAHLCWSEPRGTALSVRIDDPRFTACPLGFLESPPTDWKRGGSPELQVVQTEEAATEPQTEATTPASPAAN